MPTSSAPAFPIRLVVGLGNPGIQYQRTRHNLGFMTVDRVAERAGARFRASRFQAEVAALPGGLTLMKPLTFMNRSGLAVGAWARYHRLRPEEVLVVCDDLDLPFGRLRLRAQGSGGGHNGLKSVIAELGSQSFPRLRIGIGRPQGAGSTIEWVLSPFSPEEADRLATLLDAAAWAVECVVRDGVEAAMNQVNGRDFERR